MWLNSVTSELAINFFPSPGMGRMPCARHRNTKQKQSQYQQNRIIALELVGPLLSPINLLEPR